jgi:putative transcriptional regulator
MGKPKASNGKTRRNDKTTRLSPLAAEIAQGLLEGIEYVRGSGNARTSRVTLPDPPPAYTQMEVRRIRARLGLTQRQFAVLINVTPKSVESWEQGIRHPSQAASRLLQILGDPGKLRQFERFAHASKE